MSTILDRLDRAGPKRILSLDGGGIRGAITVGFLEEIERTLREQHRNEKLVLSDYFDLIIGTSTGAIIAGALATGKDVEYVKNLYLQIGGDVFRKRWKLMPWQWLKANFGRKTLDSALKKEFGEATFSSDTLKTGICIVAKRADKNSTWLFTNHPRDRFYEVRKTNLVRQVIRASTAAPTYFEPETINVGGGQTAEFIDGGVSMANNPSLIAFLLATIEPFNFNWTTGEQSLLTVSVGTGTWTNTSKPGGTFGRSYVYWAKQVTTMLMNDANQQNQLLVQAISKCLNPVHINRHFEDASGDLVGQTPLQTYVRYEATLELEELERLNISLGKIKLKSLRDMSNAKNRCLLHQIGVKSAQDQVKPEHFPANFKLP